MPMETIEVEGNAINIEYVRKPWIKNTYLKFVDDTLVVVSRNHGMAQRILSKHRSWISKHYNEIKSTKRLFDSNSIFYRSGRYSMSYVRSQARPRADINGNIMTVYAPSADAAERLVDRIIRKDTQRFVGEFAARKADEIGVSFRDIKVRRYRKWGACKSTRDITINYTLSMLPIELQEYVVSHEVAHLKQMNHSARFWSVVCSLCPDYKKLRKELKSYDSKRRRLFSPLTAQLLPSTQPLQE